MKRTPLKRGRKPLVRRTRLRARSKTKKYARRERGWDFMAYILKQPCAVRHGNVVVIHPCEGRVQADHAGTRGLGVKSADDTCIPLCRKHHGERTDYKGFFKNWKGPQMREWCDRMIHYYQGLYTSLVALGQTPWRES